MEPTGNEVTVPGALWLYWTASGVLRALRLQWSQGASPSTLASARRQLEANATTGPHGQ